MDQFGLVEAIDGLGECVVVAVAAAANRRLDARFGQAFAVATRIAILCRCDGSTTHRARAPAHAGPQCIEHEFDAHRIAYAPAHDTAREHVDHERHIQSSLFDLFMAPFSQELDRRRIPGRFKTPIRVQSEAGGRDRSQRRDGGGSRALPHLRDRGRRRDDMLGRPRRRTATEIASSSPAATACSTA